MKNHKVFLITAYPFNTDLISGQLWNLDIEGLTENESNLIVYAVELNSVDEKKISSKLDKLVHENLIESYSVESSLLEEINWNEEWERNLQPIRIDDKLVIKQSFKEIETKADDIVITIDPKMSFGTGEHETTKLVLGLMKDINFNSKKVLDVGSGTAVLAIAAAKLGAGEVIAIDNDEWCLVNGKENVETNDTAEIVDVRLSEIDSLSETGFDIILANINKNILIDISEQVSKRLTENGTLILSGLLYNDEEDIENVYRKKGFQKIQTKSMNEWIALKFVKAVN